MTDNSRKIYSLTKLNEALENKFMNEFGAKTFWVTAEITKVDSKGGNYYLQLADSNENITTAQMGGYIWSTNFKRIKEEVGEELKTILKSGNKALLLVKIEFHKVYGLKLNVLNIDPAFSYGEIEKRKQETIKRLKREGLFDLQKSLYFPTISKKIALVGSPQTSGFRDFKDELFNNAVYRKFKLKEFWTSVQGDRAIEEIIKALKKARNYDVDAIVLIRGGGSKMDLDVFNNYEICKTICETKTPILTGIGHETDQVVADLVAHQFFITPTAVAKHLYVQIGNFRHFLSKYYDTIQNRALEQLGGAKDEFNHLNKYLVHHSQSIIRTWRDEFQEKAYLLSRVSLNLIHDNKSKLSDASYKTHTEFRNTINYFESDLSIILNQIFNKSLQLKAFYEEGDLVAIKNKLEVAVYNLLEVEKIRINNKEELFHLLNPEKILQSGYTISTVDDEDVYLLTENLIGKELKTLTSNSIITSKITHKQNINYGKKEHDV